MRFKNLIAGKSKGQVETLLVKVQGVKAASIQLERLDFKDLLPAVPSRIDIQFFYVLA